MPELPDVETLRRYVDATSLHQPIRQVTVDAERMLEGTSAGAIRGRLEGRRFAHTARHGKYLFIAVAGGSWLVLHFGMTGRLDYAKDGTPAHTRLRIDFDDGYRLAGIWQRRFGRIDLAASPEAFAAAADLGPDAYDPPLDLDAFRTRCRDRRGGVKSALMDQSFIAGLGNVYSDEILFRAGLDPRSKIAALDDAQLQTLHGAMREVLDTAIACQADPERMPEDWLLPQRRDDGRCPRCGRALENRRVAGRRAWFCSHCQRRIG